MLFIACFVSITREHASGHQIVYEQDDKLFEKAQSAGSPVLLARNSHFEKVSSGKSQFYAIHRFDERHSWLKILECDHAGVLRQVRTIVDPQLDCATAIMQLIMLPDGRLLAILHVNPSMEVAVAVNLKSEEQLIMAGNTWTWDIKGRHIAYFQEPARNSGTPAEVWMDGNKLCDLPTNHYGDLSWDSDGTQLTATFADPQGKEMHRQFKCPERVVVSKLGR